MNRPALHRPAVTLTYCTQCNWMLRAAWLAQELLSTFGGDLASVTLVPGTGGIFVISADGVQLWERKEDGGFPDARTLKQRLRDHAWPERDLGHADRTAVGDKPEDGAAARHQGGSPAGGGGKTGGAAP